MQYTEKDHTFVICAYKESPYLETCIQSLLNQTKLGAILITTSTYCEHIQNAADKYNLELRVNAGETGIAGDWNFGYSQVETPLVTIAHQDDIYEPEYVEKILEQVNRASHPLIAFTDYGELRNDRRVYKNSLLRIKRILLSPLQIKMLQRSKFIRRRSLSLGNGICCPSVMYVRCNLPNKIFETGFRSDLDWQAWEQLSRIDGNFIYCPECLLFHRIHSESETSRIITDNSRKSEDEEMFCRFWPKPIAKLLAKVYSTSEKSNTVT